MQLCLAVAKGEKLLDRETANGTALYFCLEDGDERIQKRLYELTDEPSDNLFFSIMADSIGCGLEEQITKFKSAHDDLHLVVIDTLQKEYKEQYEKFGLNIVYYRKKKKLTQLQLAEQIGVDRSHISAIELGNVGVSFDVIFKLCEVLEVKPKDLFDFRD